MIPGEILTAEGEIVLNRDLATTRIEVANSGDRPIQVGSHFHFFEANPELTFVREQARGMRLDLPAGTAMRFEPGQTRTVVLVPYRGKRRAVGFNGQVMGTVDGDG